MSISSSHKLLIHEGTFATWLRQWWCQQLQQPLIVFLRLVLPKDTSAYGCSVFNHNMPRQRKMKSKHEHYWVDLVEIRLLCFGHPMSHFVVVTKWLPRAWKWSILPQLGKLIHRCCGCYFLHLALLIQRASTKGLSACQVQVAIRHRMVFYNYASYL